MAKAICLPGGKKAKRGTFGVGALSLQQRGGCPGTQHEQGLVRGSGCCSRLQRSAMLPVPPQSGRRFLGTG